MAFGKNNEDLEKIWSLIPKDIDILITHEPPLNILDEVNNKHVGNPILLKKIKILCLNIIYLDIYMRAMVLKLVLIKEKLQHL